VDVTDGEFVTVASGTTVKVFVTALEMHPYGMSIAKNETEREPTVTPYNDSLSEMTNDPAANDCRIQ
jgi:hypothetical protein